MIALLLLWLSPGAAMLLLLLVLRVRSKKLLISLPLGALLLPILLVASIYVVRAPIQQGKVMAEWGPLLNLVFPADDLYTPLAGAQLEADRRIYNLDVTHKYVGNHALELRVPSRGPSDWSVEKRLKIQASYFLGGQPIMNFERAEGSPFMGANQYGFTYSWYRVPRDVPVGATLHARVTIHGELRAFLKEHGGAVLAVRKQSDK